LSKTSLISIIDDDESSREAITSLMKSLQFTVKNFASAADFLAFPDIRNTGCLITDVNMPGMKGTELHSHLVESGYAIPTILITAWPEDSTRSRALAAGAIGYLSKPLDADALLGCVRTALKQGRAEKDLS
jgi:FixJ family two-component response regulator